MTLIQYNVHWSLLKKQKNGPRAVAHACNPKHFGRPRQADHKIRSLRPAWPTWWNLVSTKNTKISQAWQHMPVIPATQEAKAGESLEPRRWRLQWAEITPLHSSLGNKRETLSQKKRKELVTKHYIQHVAIHTKHTDTHMCTGTRLMRT